MSGEAPTVVGSIVGRLILDASQWNAELDKAEGKARALGAVDPNIRVTADTAAAKAGLDSARASTASLTAASLKLDAAQISASNAASLQYVAELRLGQALENHEEDSYSVIVAQEALNRITDSAALSLNRETFALDQSSIATSLNANEKGRLTAASLAAAASLDLVNEAALKDGDLTAAELKLAAAADRSANAHSAYARAVLVLNEMKEKGTSSALQLDAAERTLARTFSAAERAALGELVAVKALDQEQKDLAASALVAAAAETTLATSAKNAGLNYELSSIQASEANKTRIRRMAVIVTLVAGLIAMGAPLAAWATGVAGSLAGMASAGVLAIVGIKKAMEAGTEEGVLYAEGLASLKKDFGDLGETSATSMLGYFQRSVSDINSAMPNLNSQIGLFSDQLGYAGSVTLRGVIQAFEVMNPLFVMGGQYVGELAAGFEAWTSDGGLQKFTTYAMNVFPVVTDAIGRLANGAVDLLIAFAPIGEVLLGFAGGIGTTFTALTNLGDAFPIIVGGIAAAVLAFKAWGIVAPMLALVTENVAYLTRSMVVLNAATTISQGYIGWIVAAFGALAAIIGIVVASNNDATEATENYTAALREDGGVIGDATRLQLAKALADGEAVDAGKRLGISTKTVMDAALGQKDALAKVAVATNVANDSFTEFSKGQSIGTMLHTENGKAASANAEDVKILNDAIRANSDAIDDAIRYGITFNDAMGLGGKVAQTMAGGLGMSRDAYDELTASMTLAEGAAKTWRTQVDILNGGALDILGAKLRAAADTTSWKESLKGYMEELGQVEAVSLDMNSVVGNSNLSFVKSSLENIADIAEAQIAASGDSQEAIYAINEEAKASVETFYDMMVQAGFSAEEVRNLIEDLGLFPPVVKTFLEVNLSQADKLMTGWVHRWSGVLKNSLAVEPRFDFTRPVPEYGLPAIQFQAFGGTIHGAGTATSDSVPAMLSVGEEVISNANGQADRWRPTLKAINAGQTPQMAGNVSAPVNRTNSQPIYMDGSLFGVLKTIANGEAQIVLNAGFNKAALEMVGGLS